ncbi:hypothetical protein BH18ACT11_BH18ACT11_10140 [soil metagenome]
MAEGLLRSILPSLSAAQKKSLSEEVLDHLREAIVRGRLDDKVPLEGD